MFQSEGTFEGTSRPRPAKASVANGSFSEVTSYKFGDGLVPGKHRVAIVYANDKSGKSLVPADYVDISKSPLVIDTADAPLAIKVPKP